VSEQKLLGSDNQPEQRAVGLLFLANFVHQVVNPLSGVVGTLHNINDGTYSGEVVKQKINACRGQLEGCIALIRNLAYLSDYFFETQEDAALRPAREGASSILPQVVIEAIQFFQIAAEKRSMKLELVNSRTQYKIAVRPELLRQVFINMFDNWLKYGLRDQTIRVESRVNDKKELVIEIVGKSVGFDNSESEKLFELGYRSKSAQEKVAQGSGIGLYICRQIVEKTVSGKISAVHSNSRGESTFRVVVPREKWQV